MSQTFSSCTHRVKLHGLTSRLVDTIIFHHMHVTLPCKRCLYAGIRSLTLSYPLINITLDYVVASPTHTHGFDTRLLSVFCHNNNNGVRINAQNLPYIYNYRSIYLHNSIIDKK